jgi:glutathione synthase/RimK-type ligase-like ATP-grasp enzyme
LTTAKGGRRERAVLTEAQIAAALEATHLQELSIAGVDMFMSHGALYLIEVNESPQFRIFEKVVRVNAAQKIIEYISK